MNTRKFYCLITFTLLQGCAWFSGSQNLPKVKIPRVANQPVAGGVGDEWRYLGNTESGGIAEEINDKSIMSQALQVYSFEDRKTIINPKTFAYTAGSPQYKYVLSYWLMDCNNKQYLLNSSALYNESAALIESDVYTTRDNVKWLTIGNSSIAELQYNYVCLNQNRLLGY